MNQQRINQICGSGFQVNPKPDPALNPEFGIRDILARIRMRIRMWIRTKIFSDF
jgi:hypothetical protein